MYQITMEVPEETIVNGRSNVIIFKSERINDVDVAWRVFDTASCTARALNMNDVYVNMIQNGTCVAWYRKNHGRTIKLTGLCPVSGVKPKQQTRENNYELCTYCLSQRFF